MNQCACAGHETSVFFWSQVFEKVISKTPEACSEKEILQRDPGSAQCGCVIPSGLASYQRGGGVGHEQASEGRAKFGREATRIRAKKEKIDAKKEQKIDAKKESEEGSREEDR